MKPCLRLLTSALLLAATSVAAAEITKYRLWPNGNPAGWSVEGPEQSDVRGEIERVKNVNVPTLTYYPPAKPDPVFGRGAMIICPGGGYSILAIDHEGREIAEWLNSLGMHAFVLKYRLPKKDSDPSNWHVPVQDAQRGISLARQLATHLGYRQNKIGIMGFSAGGHLTAATSNAFEGDFDHIYSFSDPRAKRPTSKRTYTPSKYEPSSHPDFAGLIYPAYLIGDPETNALSPEVQVRPQTPPTFLVHTQDDHITAVSSLAYYRELKAAFVPSEIHVFAKGGHGYGLRKKEERIGMWPDLMAGWLKGLLAD
ncbi:MAG: alpha/beta hydrolase [Verrucomicrobiota bacterium]